MVVVANQTAESAIISKHKFNLVLIRQRLSQKKMRFSGTYGVMERVENVIINILSGSGKNIPEWEPRSSV